ncbi:hypothetical protein CAPTEDRAFT_113225 [Capitella teleta]|uniref:N-glycosylase/DNA lyase n=1 Tax=Capitella teleta TaxID=283909 RepID=R7U5K1_CAPTE|nr:hypothetical protein CAPTEDRAFT_113225 [Capitella teleta]|eukprot:ELU01650.1 hypothetical protein CAPTEDRAFT_113225 [Capitella teleta]
MAWRKIACSKTELDLGVTLICGQSFRWKETAPGEWTGVLKNLVWNLKQSDDLLFYKTLEESPAASSDLTQEDILKDYFQLHVNLSKLYEQWSSDDPNFKSKASSFRGVRILRQDPVENLFSFICSSNNNISRISGMVERMCEEFGTSLGEYEGLHHYSFPSIESLAKGSVEQKLRKLGFGYRAKYINQSARFIMENHSEHWLHNLRKLPYNEAKSELMKLCGVGAKVADCVCLMSLDKNDVVPVDTHVWQIAQKYLPSLRSSKTITPQVYNAVGNHFRELWGEYAGWAHSVSLHRIVYNF